MTMQTRGRKMPGVRIAEPEVRWPAWSDRTGWIPKSVRMAISVKEKLRRPRMRGVVMPGMAAVFHRPALISPKSRGYNRACRRWLTVTCEQL
jgi:hypothetical protein